MKVLLTSAYAPDRALKAMRAAVPLDRFGVHTVTEDPSDADIILFVENAHYDTDPFYKRLRKHELVRRYPEKTFMYDENDHAFCCLPGLYCSMPRRGFQPTRQRAFCYVHTINDAVRQDDVEPDLLFSFLGAVTHPIRSELLALRDDRAHVEDTTAFSIWHAGPEEQRTRQARYADVLARSRFVLCPRGAGTCSHRLFEVMRAARAPVVIADEWVAPEGPDWETFCVRVAEKDVQHIPALLREREAEAQQRGLLARQAWLEWYAPDVIFHRAIEACGELLLARRVPERMARLVPTSPYIRYRVGFPVRVGWRKLRWRLREMVRS